MAGKCESECDGGNVCALGNQHPYEYHLCNTVGCICRKNVPLGSYVKESRNRDSVPRKRKQR